MKLADIENLIDEMHGETCLAAFDKIKSHPKFQCIVEALRLLNELTQPELEGTAWLIGLVECYSCYAVDALALLPEVTGDDPVPQGTVRSELLLVAQYWMDWARQKDIEPILEGGL